MSGFGFANGTTISSITNGTTLVLNQAPLLAFSGETIQFGVPLANANFVTGSGFLPRVTINGNSWATWGSNGLAAFTAYNTSSDLTTGAITDVMQVNDATLNTSAGTSTLLARRRSRVWKSIAPTISISPRRHSDADQRRNFANRRQ